jgi:CheY-like chemotaxis protein
MTQKILVVDDQPIVRQGTAIVVKGFGFEADEAASGGEALANVKNRQYDLILMDYNMPEMDGFQCTQQIRAMEKGTGKRIPIICMTANPERDIKESCLNAGMDDYLDKACTNEQLKTVVLRWVAVNGAKSEETVQEE